jgi:hypothetical protein
MKTRSKVHEFDQLGEFKLRWSVKNRKDNGVIQFGILNQGLPIRLQWRV